MAVSVHTIAFKGPAGINFVLLMVASIFYILGFGTNAWSKNPVAQNGLWENCRYSEISGGPAWFVATQVLITMGLVGLIIAVVLTTLYMCVHQISKNMTLIALVSISLGSTLLMLIGIIIYGAKASNLSWSFGMAIIGMIFTCAAGVLSIVQMKKSDVACFGG